MEQKNMQMAFFPITLNPSLSDTTSQPLPMPLPHSETAAGAPSKGRGWPITTS